MFMCGEHSSFCTAFSVPGKDAALTAPTGLRPPAQGCRVGYPGKENDDSFNRSAVAPASALCKWRNRFAVDHSFPSSQGSRGGNPGLEGAAPLGQTIQVTSRPRLSSSQ